MKVVDVRAKSSAGLDLSAAGKLFLDLDPRLAIVRDGKVRELPDRARYAEPNGSDLLAGAGAFSTLSGWTQSGGGSASIVDGELSIDNASNSPPVLTVPGTQSTNEDTNKSITGISVADSEDASLTVSLSVSHGLISLASTSGITFNSGGQAQASMEITGTKANLNTALGTVTYAPTANYNGADALAISVEDAAEATDSDSITINVGAINDAPVLTVPGTQTGTEDTTKTVTGISVADVDHSSLTMQVSVTNGVLSLAQTTGLSFSVNDGTADATMTFFGTLTNINLALASILVAPTANFAGAAVLTIVATDAAAGEDTDTVTINFAAVNDRPTMTASGGNTAYTENGSAVVVDGAVTVADVDDTNIESAVVQITSGFHTGDILSVVNQFGVTNAWFPGTQSLVIEGTATKAQYEAVLQTVKFASSSDDPTGTNRVVTYSVSDGNLDSTGVTKTIAVTPVNDGPVITVPSTQTGTEDTAKVMSGNVFSVADPDHTSLTMGFAVDHGTVTLASMTGLTVNSGANGSAALNVTGTKTSLNTALGTVTVTPTANFNGACVLAITASDGAGGSDSKNVTITFGAVNDGPSLSGSAPAIDYLVGDAPVALFTSLTVTDIDSANMASATVSLTGDFEDGVDLLDVTEAFGITKAFNTATGVLTLTGPATKANWQALLRSVTGESTSVETYRTLGVQFQVNDGSANSNVISVNWNVIVPAIPPESPENFSVVPYAPDGRNGLTAIWTAPSSGETPVGYELRIGTPSQSWEASFPSASPDFPAVTADLLELPSDTEWDVWIAAYTGGSGGVPIAYSTPIMYTCSTLENEPPIIVAPGDDEEITIVDPETAIATFQAEDPEEDAVVWSVESHDLPGSPSFNFDVDGLLTVDPKPPIGLWHLTIRGTDTLGAFDEVSVILTVLPLGVASVTVEPNSDGNPYTGFKITWPASLTAEIDGYELRQSDTDDGWDAATPLDEAPSTTYYYDDAGANTAKYVYVKSFKDVAAVRYYNATATVGYGTVEALAAPTLVAPVNGDQHYDTAISATPGTTIRHGETSATADDWFTWTIPDTTPYDRPVKVTLSVQGTPGWIVAIPDAGLTFISGGNGTDYLEATGAKSDVESALTGVLFTNENAPDPGSVVVVMNLENDAGPAGEANFTLNFDGPGVGPYTWGYGDAGSAATGQFSPGLAPPDVFPDPDANCFYLYAIDKLGSDRTEFVNSIEVGDVLKISVPSKSTELFVTVLSVSPSGGDGNEVNVTFDSAETTGTFTPPDAPGDDVTIEIVP